MTPAQHLQKRGGPSQEEAEQRYEHGTYARYTLAMCRCFKCRLANGTYVNAIAAARRLPWRLVKGHGNYIEHRETGERITCPDRVSCYVERDRRNARAPQPKPPNELISAKKARRHLIELGKKGVGLKSVHAACGIATSVLWRIFDGSVKRTRRRNEARILAVGLEAARGTAKIDGRETHRLLDALVGCRLYAKTWLARELGSTAKIPALQISRSRPTVAAKNVKRVRALYDRLLETDARFRQYIDPEGERDREAAAAIAAATAASRAKLATALKGWDADEFAMRFSRFDDLAST